MLNPSVRIRCTVPTARPAPRGKSAISSVQTKSWVDLITHSIRPALASERKALEDLQRRASLKWDEQRADGLTDIASIVLPAEQIAAGLVIVLEHWGAPAGFAVVVPREDGHADLDGPFVEPELWRGGFGRMLVEEAAQFATALEAGVLVAVASPRAVPFYAKCGFSPAGTANTSQGPVALMSRSLVF